MTLSTSTSTLAVGASRTFNLSPGSALTLTTLPNCRVTVTETPNIVSASGVGGNSSRTHNLQLGQTVTYGPYPMGGTVVVANASNSGGAVTWVRSDALVAESASGVVSLVSGDGTPVAVAAMPSSYYQAFIPGRQFITSGTPKDLSGNSADAVLASSQTDAALWANNGYMTTAAGANLGVSIPLAKSSINLAAESFIFSVLMNKAATAGSENIFGMAQAGAGQGFYLSVRATSGAMRPVFVTAVDNVTGLADSAIAFADGTDHVLTLMYDAFTKLAYLYRDGALVNTYTTTVTPVTGTSVPVNPFALGASAVLTGAVCKFAGVHLLKMTGGLPPNYPQLAARLAARPFDYLANSDVLEVGRRASAF